MGAIGDLTTKKIHLVKMYMLVVRKMVQLRIVQEPNCSHYVYIYLKSMHEPQRLRTTTNETFVNIHFKVICISNYTLLFSALIPCTKERSKFS